MILAHHIILTGYGHWLPNDPRGSLSREIRKPDLRPLGEVHFGRKADQPSGAELRGFFRRAEPKLAFPLLWFEGEWVDVIGHAIGDVIRRDRLTCYACGVMRNHVHVVIRRHRIQAQDMIEHLKEATRAAVHAKGLCPSSHPVWSQDPYVAYKDNPRAIRQAIRYIERNFTKHRLVPQDWDFVIPYDGWPHPRA